MRNPAGAAVIVPSPERRVFHLELHGPAQALTGDGRGTRKLAGFDRLRASLETCSSSGVDREWGIGIDAFLVIGSLVAVAR
jgi:hypothetical protein